MNRNIFLLIPRAASSEIRLKIDDVIQTYYYFSDKNIFHAWHVHFFLFLSLIVIFMHLHISEKSAIFILLTHLLLEILPKNAF